MKLLRVMMIFLLACDPQVTHDAAASNSTTSGIQRDGAPNCGPGLCDDLAAWCTSTALPSETCALLSGLVCPGNPCDACAVALDACALGGGDCTPLELLCKAAPDCGCGWSCEVPANELSIPELFALCFAHPWTIGKSCEAPDVGQCLATMQASCAPTACAYLDCLDALEQDPCQIPPVCERIAECGDEA